MQISTQNLVHLKHVGRLECLNNQAHTLIKLVKHPRKLASVQVLSFDLILGGNCELSATYLDIAVPLDCIFRRLK